MKRRRRCQKLQPLKKEAGSNNAASFLSGCPQNTCCKKVLSNYERVESFLSVIYLTQNDLKRKRPRVPPGQPRPSTGAKPEDVSGTAPRFCAPIWILIFGNETAVRYAFPPVPKVGFFGAFCHFNTVQPAAAIKRTGRSHHTYRPVNDNAPSGFAIRRHMSPLSIPNY